MTGGPYSRERRQRSLHLFAVLALVAGPVVLVVGIVMALGGPGDDGGTEGADDGRPLELQDSVAAGQDLLVMGSGEMVELWGSPADLDLAAVACSTRDGSLEVDGAPDAAGSSTRVDADGTEWTRLIVLEDVQRSVTCSGGGLAQVGVAHLASGPGARGGVFFVVWGVIITAAGLLARRFAGR